MLSKNKIKFIKSLQNKKQRTEHNCFVVEGRKGIVALLDSPFEVLEIYVSEKALELEPAIKKLNPSIIEEDEIKKAAGLSNNMEGIAVVQQIGSTNLSFEKSVLYLDGVSDPGNLGTIIRTADWFGIQHVICSPNCVEFYNPKTIQSTMGSFANIVPQILSVKEFMVLKPQGMPVFLAELNGEHPTILSGYSAVVLVMGSESHGVSKDWKAFNYTSVTIPAAPNSKAESLNVGVATSILCYQLQSSY